MSDTGGRRRVHTRHARHVRLQPGAPRAARVKAGKDARSRRRRPPESLVVVPQQELRRPVQSLGRTRCGRTVPTADWHVRTRRLEWLGGSTWCRSRFGCWWWIHVRRRRCWRVRRTAQQDRVRSLSLCQHELRTEGESRGMLHPLSLLAQLFSLKAEVPSETRFGGRMLNPFSTCSNRKERLPSCRCRRTRICADPGAQATSGTAVTPEAERNEASLAVCSRAGVAKATRETVSCRDGSLPARFSKN